MTFQPGVSKTKIVPEGRRFQARFYDTDLRLWFDLGDPRDTEPEARALIAEFNDAGKRRAFADKLAHDQAVDYAQWVVRDHVEVDERVKHLAREYLIRTGEIPRD